MSQKLTATTSINIDAPVSKVWQAITDPAMIKQYLFGTDTHTDWKQGSDITYTGEWKGKEYTDKGKIIEIIPERKLHTTYLSGLSNKEDKPENYANVIYEVTPGHGHTVVTLSQDNIEDEQQQQHMHENWSLVLQGMKKVVEHKETA